MDVLNNRSDAAIAVECARKLVFRELNLEWALYNPLQVVGMFLSSVDGFYEEQREGKVVGDVVRDGSNSWRIRRSF